MRAGSWARSGDPRCGRWARRSGGAGVRAPCRRAGGEGGAADDETSMPALHAAVDAAVNFIDTADVYGDGRSERLVGRLRRERAGETIYVATKAGRRLPAQTVEGYNRDNLTAWVDR